MMLGGRSRSRSRRKGTRWGALLVVALVAGTLAAGFMIAPSTAFTSGAVDRETTATVADDAGGFLGIDVADGVRAGSDDRLVTVTNNLGQPLTVTVSSSATLSNQRATLDPGDSLTTTARVSCASPPSELRTTITANANDQLTGIATRSASVDTAGCSNTTTGFGAVEIVDRSTSNKGGKAEYGIDYTIDGDTDSFDRVSVDFENVDKGDGVQTRESFSQSGTVAFSSGGQRFNDRYSITVRIFDETGEIESERIVVTDTADGGGVVYEQS